MYQFLFLFSFVFFSSSELVLIQCLRTDQVEINFCFWSVLIAFSEELLNLVLVTKHDEFFEVIAFGVVTYLDSATA